MAATRTFEPTRDAPPRMPAEETLRHLHVAGWRDLFSLFDCYSELPGNPARERWLAELARARPEQWRQLSRLLALEQNARRHRFLRERAPCVRSRERAACDRGTGERHDRARSGPYSNTRKDPF